MLTSMHVQGRRAKLHYLTSMHAPVRQNDMAYKAWAACMVWQERLRQQDNHDELRCFSTIAWSTNASKGETGPAAELNQNKLDH